MANGPATPAQIDAACTTLQETGRLALLNLSVEPLDVPAWMINAAVKVGAQEKTPDIEQRIEVWNYGRAKPHTEDAPLREMVVR